MPASRSRISRSTPTTAPSAAPTLRRSRTSQPPRVVALLARSIDRLLLAGGADRGTARAAVGLEDVAVEPDRTLAERLEVDDGAQRAADQSLDLDRAAALLATGGLPLGALAGRCRQQRVLGRHPAPPGLV